MLSDVAPDVAAGTIKEKLKVKKLALLILVAAMPCFSQLNTAAGSAKSKKANPEVKEGITQEQADAILVELKAIHQLLERQQAAVPAQAQAQAPQNIKVSVKLEPVWQAIGREDAPVTIIEFSDYQCPFCRKYHADTFAELKKNYIDTGKVRYITRDFPLSFHANAQSAALAAHCAADQNNFWEMRDLLLGTSADLSSDSITKYAEQLHLDMNGFRACQSAEKYAGDIQKDLAAASSLGVNATPTFVIGKTAKDKIEGLRVAGALNYPSFESIIKDQLRPQPLATAAQLNPTQQVDGAKSANNGSKVIR